MCCKRCHIIFLTFSLNGVGLKNQIRLLFFLRYDPPIVFRRQSHITFIFIKTMSHDLLVQMTYFSWIHIFDAFSLKRVTCEFKKQYTNSGVQRSPWSVFRKPQFFHTFSVILMLSNYRKCMGKPIGFLKTDHGLLCTPDLVYFFFELASYSFQRESIKYMNSARNSWLWILVQIF